VQDKKFLETKVAELTSTLELVQNQRNDLRQQFRVRTPSAPLVAVAASRLFGLAIAAGQHDFLSGR